MSDGAIVGCQCMDRVFVTKAEDWGTHLADVMTALVRDRDNETARLRGALEQALGWIATAGNTPDWVRLEKAEDIIDAALRVPQTADSELIACPHWEPGKITMRKGCTACAATPSPSDADT
jgi:hypothetical protein